MTIDGDQTEFGWYRERKLVPNTGAFFYGENPSKCDKDKKYCVIQITVLTVSKVGM